MYPSFMYLWNICQTILKFAACVVLSNISSVTTDYNKDSIHIPVHVSEPQIPSHYFVRTLISPVFLGSNLTAVPYLPNSINTVLRSYIEWLKEQLCLSVNIRVK
jgi:hypothetical protein